ncbi:unnamed protein product [Cyclocybe aegerita]|uniref:F-box domain-containing protein n=1 Tax=Cyclocybe aegerita TaxID=1973307 RepID=A0A8S0VZD4_CYCAE|nr:unnamed protein product [Cyclocybe aegerita]
MSTHQDVFSAHRTPEILHLTCPTSAEAHPIASMLEVNAIHDPFTACLPTEIASRILTFCADDEQEIGRRIPLALSAVSRKWRDIAQSTPALWTSIRLEFNSAPIQSSYEETLRHWLLLSSQRPLSIHFSIDEDFDRENPLEIQAYRAIIDILNVHSYRWEKLFLQIPLHLLNLFCSQIRGTPALRWLSINSHPSIDSHPDDVDDAQIAKFNLGGPLPTPRTVSIYACRLRRIRIDWTKVTHVQMFVAYISECLTLFATAPRLRECKLINVRHDDSAYPSTPIVHHHLLKLEIAMAWLNSTTPLFDHLCFPSLESLRYSCDSQPLDPLHSFLIRSSAPLKFLRINEDDFFHYGNKLTDLLWTIPSLEEFELYGARRYEKFWELLATYSEGSLTEQFLPMLTSLSLDSISNDDGEYNILEICEALKVRASRDRANRELGVLKRLNWDVNILDHHHEYYLEEETLQFFERLIADGLDFKITNLQFDGLAMLSTYFVFTLDSYLW